MNDHYYELLFTNKEFDLHFNSRLSNLHTQNISFIINNNSYLFQATVCNVI